MKCSMTRQTLSAVVVFGATAILAACSGGTGGGDQDFSGSDFVADGNSGSIDLRVSESAIPVSQTSGFRVFVKNAKGEPVPDLRISCDSEAGVAIIEPSTGTEVTDAGGQISGRIGCAAPGSYQFGCRLPVGANFRKFTTILCTGDVPAGFSGFPGAAGGGLGTGGAGGSGDGGPGGTNTSGVRITSVILNDAGQDGPSVDVIASDCANPPTNPPTNPEPFSDTLVKVKVVNNTNSAVRFTRLSYNVPNSDGNGSSFTSQRLGFIGGSEVGPNGGSETLVSLFASAVNGQKRFAGSNVSIPPTLGFTNFTIILEGVGSNGQNVRITAGSVASFANFNRCGSQS